jgi:hypothetical protein
VIRLVDLNPAWIDQEGRKGLGVAYDCILKHCKLRIWTLFANPLDGGPAYVGNSRALILDLKGDEDAWNIIGCGDFRWTRKGDTFETLSMTPSVDAYEHGHKTLTDGLWT